VELFGHRLSIPVLAGPVGLVGLHFSETLGDREYNDILVSSCAKEGIVAMTGDGADKSVVPSACEAIKKAGGCGIPTIKPWDIDTLKEKFELVHSCGAFACAMDVDGAGLPFLKKLNTSAGSKSEEEMAEIIRLADLPFIIKGIMTVKGAMKALKAGASGIVVSNHGGRVLDQCPSTAEVLPEIAAAVGGRMKILVDGGIRDGVDIFKALALGADAVIIARPYVTALYGDRENGVSILTKKLVAELEDTMEMCGAAKIADITREMVRI